MSHDLNTTNALNIARENTPRGAASDSDIHRLLPLVYNELRAIAASCMRQESPGRTLQPTALVHEAFARLAGTSTPREWSSPQHFVRAAAGLMRRILIDAARRRGARKRGGNYNRLKLEQVGLTIDNTPEEAIDLDEALEALAKEHPLKAELVRLCYFGGLTREEAAAVLDIPTGRQLDGDWAYARAWLHRRLNGYQERSPLPDCESNAE